ncbi:dihydrolipoamide acetyltransferase family protein [Pollutimonas harenae]|uniref:Dihydrolipoamide acetyltransferase component of pyruvate dehydrogenase complex n=1 Tax=Pollutimonas harenae TaxID=657015 RepID=A0A853GXS5_9BURK|nr:dihydrolipoamide acetyltransferase family protein [Pollutimonas harenae]NYT84159.1 2-oxo acid dehydrogenase subunit E2 [Pollutimonas harenae]TEA73425.1 2-oxo acid dehydrogenase subunit E2 [Pollutimonas harenae]
MTINILMPGVGAGTSYGRIVQWVKKKGEHVAVGDTLAEIETDKAVLELESFDEGVLQDIIVNAGDEEVASGSVIAVLSASAGPLVQVTATSPEPTGKLNRQFASPSARRLARQLDVDIATLRGSGPKGRVVRIDIEQAAAQAPSISDKKVVMPAVASTPAELVPHSLMRKTIARRLQESKQQIPHFYLTVDCRMDALLLMRAHINQDISRLKRTAKITINDILVYAVARAMERVPDVNVRWTEQAIERHGTVDISVAVAAEKGLVTPVVRNAQQKNLETISKELLELVSKARSGQLAPADYEGGGLTISNLGTHGVKVFSAIINPPQAAILAFGAAEKRPIVQDDTLAIGTLMSVTLSADHRAIDGAVGARFLAELKSLLEAPLGLLI